MKVLIVRFSSIGDIVLTTPVIRCVKQQVPGVEVHYLTKSEYRAVVAHNPYIDKLFYLEDDLGAVIEELKKEKYDYVIDLHNNLRTARVKQALETKSYAFPKLNVQKWMLVNLKLDIMPDKSIVERYFETVQPLGVRNDTKGLDYFIPDTAKVDQNDLPMSHWAGYVACVIGGSYETKKFPAEKWKLFFAAMPFPAVLLGGPEDRDLGQEIAKDDPVRIYNACGKFNLNESADLVRRARVVISNDTGLMHVAAAFQKPVISLWGNTAPEMGMFPYYGANNLKERVAPQSVIMENKKLYCHPCSKLGYARCPKRHFKCMNELDTSAMSKKVQELWKQ
ncbi:glycosyltransferase family 9 protein [Chitinophagaceae bacterium MMS25-I14]